MNSSCRINARGSSAPLVSVAKANASSYVRECDEVVIDGTRFRYACSGVAPNPVLEYGIPYVPTARLREPGVGANTCLVENVGELGTALH